MKYFHRVRCEECGKMYTLLAQHTRQAHGMSGDEYRLKYNIPLTLALVDDNYRLHLSDKAKLRAQTDEGIANIRRMLASCDRQKQTGQKRVLPQASLEHCHRVNAAKSKAVREDVLPQMLPDWMAGMSSRDISIKHLVAMATLRKWVRDGYLPKRVLQCVVVGQ